MAKSHPYALRPDETLGPGLRRILEAMGDDAEELSSLPESQLPEAVHDLRTLIKRLRAYLWFVRPVLGPSRYERHIDRLRRAARRLSQARDLEVIQGTLKRAASPEAHKRELAALTHVALVVTPKDSSLNPTVALSFLKKSARTFTHINAKSRKALEQSRKKWPEPKERLAKAFAATRKAKKKALKDKEALFVHAWRKKTKRLLYVLQLIHRVPRIRNHDYLETVDQLQELLGQHQDAIVTGDHLRLRASNLDSAKLATVIRVLDRKREKLLEEAEKCWETLLHEV